MDENRKLTLKNIFSISAYVILAGVTLFLYFYSQNGGKNMRVFHGVLIGFLLIFWVIMDFVRPLMLQELKGITKYKMSLFYRMAVADFFGYAGLVYFVVNFKKSSEAGIIGALIFVICMGYKRSARSDFEKSEEA